ncbi:hypothetical protein MAUB1S_01426 [Mycolicibacterium aubagnense]
MTVVTRWISYFIIVIGLTVAPGLIAIGLATSAQAQPNTSASTSSSVHQAFPHQQSAPQPGTSIHHHHQHNR